MSEDRELNEFYEDFGAQPLPASELDAILERARIESDRQLRLLLKEDQIQRWLLPQLLEPIERGAEYPNETEDQLLKLARFIVRRDGAIGGA